MRIRSGFDPDRMRIHYIVWTHLNSEERGEDILISGSQLSQVDTVDR